MSHRFHIRLVEERKRAGYTKHYMARKLAISEEAYGELEEGEKEPGLDMLETIADVLGCSLDQLFGRTVFYARPEIRVDRVCEKEQVYGEKEERAYTNQKKLEIGTEDFRRWRECGIYYVDKTHMISEFLESWYQVTLVTRPRRFGKTLNMSMLAEFLDCTKDSKALFAGTKIMGSRWMEQMNRSPVIFLSFLNVDANSAKGMLITLGDIIQQEYQRHASALLDGKLPAKEIEEFGLRYKHLATEDKVEQLEHELVYSIRFLSQLLNLYYGTRVYILIDEYDKPFMSANSGGYYEEVRKTLSGILSVSLKGNPYLEKAMLTGIQRVAKENAFSGLNNMAVCTVKDPEYGDCFGFTENEVKQLFANFNVEFSEEIRHMYNGYQFGDARVYNPWSVSNYIFRKKLEPYWIHTAENGILKNALRRCGTSFERNYQRLIQNGEVTVKINLSTAYYEHQSDAALWGLLANAGMLTIIQDLGDDRYRARVPNREVWTAFGELTAATLRVEEEDWQNIFDSLIRGDMEEFAESYQKVMLKLPSYYDLKDENSYHMMVLGMCVFLQKNYKVISNREAGDGRGDIVLKPKRDGLPGVIFEFKYTKDRKKDLEMLAIEGVDQIEDKRYKTELGEIPIFAIGLAHRGKETAVKWKEL